MKLPISDDDKHPIAIAIADNKEMAAFDLQILVGNFKTEEAAMEYANGVKEFLEEHAGADMGRIQ